MNLVQITDQKGKRRVGLVAARNGMHKKLSGAKEELTDSLKMFKLGLEGGKVIWEKPFLTGEANISHTLANLEYHHFKYDGFRRPGDLHIHYFGTATLSIADNVKTEDGDVFEISAPPFGAPLRNPLKVVKSSHKPGSVKAL